MSEADPCPSENCVPETSPGPVRNEETVVRFVEKKEHVKQDEGGSWRLVPAAVTKEELSARGGHSFSLIREAYVNNVELKARARARSCAELEGNPILARTQTERLRALTDENGRREICINSDPTTEENDPLGACPAHASALRSGNPPRSKQRVEWQILRTLVGECFSDVRHFNGEAITE
jgi:hypothetical protein